MLKFSDLRRANDSRQDQWDSGERIDLPYLGNAMAGECGEACNVIKKLTREELGLRGAKATVQDLADELADVVIYVDLIAKKVGVDLGQAVIAKFNKTSEKYGLAERLSPA